MPALATAFDEPTDRDDLLRRLAAERGFYIPSFYDVTYGRRHVRRRSSRSRGTGAPPVVRKAAVKSTDALDPPATQHLHARHRVRVALPHRGRARLRQPLPLLLGRLQLPAGAGVSRRPHPRARREARRAREPRRTGVDRALRSPGHRAHPRAACSTWATGSAPPRCASTTSPSRSSGMLRESGERSMTIAPETGSDRLRRVINKTVTNDEILDKRRADFCERHREPEAVLHDRPPDRDRRRPRRHSRSDAADARHHAEARAGRAAASAASSPASTRWCRSPARRISGCRWKSRRSSTEDASGFATLIADIDNVYFNIKSERHSFYQALLSLGDRRVAPAIEAAERNGGNWRDAVADAGVDADFYIFRDRTRDTVLPWDIIDGGMKEPFFRSEFDKSLREEWTLPPKRAAENAQADAGALTNRRGRHSHRPRRVFVLRVRLENEIAQPVPARCCRQSAAAAQSSAVRRLPRTARGKCHVAAGRCAAPTPRTRPASGPRKGRPRSGPLRPPASPGLPLSFDIILTVMERLLDAVNSSLLWEAHG